jgi:hypothetical protein
VRHSILALEVCMRLEPSLRYSLRERIVQHPAGATHQEKWNLYRGAADELLSHLGHIERGCWDYFNDDARAQKDFKMWCDGMTTEEGARTSPSGQPDPYRGEPRYMTFTMAFLLAQDSPCDLAIRSICNIPDSALWRRNAFQRVLQGIGYLNFAAVRGDVIYVIPGDDAWGLTAEDLTATKFDYLRTVIE